MHDIIADFVFGIRHQPADDEEKLNPSYWPREELRSTIPVIVLVVSPRLELAFPDFLLRFAWISWISLSS